MEFRGKRRRRTGMSYYMAVGLCIAAAFLTVLSAVINKKNAETKAEADYTGWAEEEIADTPGDGEYAGLEFPGLTDSNAGEQLEGGAEESAEEADATPMRRQPDENEASGQEDNEQDSAREDTDVIAVDAPLPAAKLTPPVNGNIIKPYSGTELVFCSTFGDWRVHEGTDIAADPGSEVHAAAAGVVMDFVEDPLYGYSVVINQDDDAFMYYCGLSSTCMVSSGVRVETGDVIGYVGEVPCEAGDGSHIHVAMMKDGRFVDPGKYFP